MSEPIATMPPFADRIPADVMADLEAVLESVRSGRPLDPLVKQRVRDEADRIREDVYHRQGLLDIGVPSIRELRDQ